MPAPILVAPAARSRDHRWQLGALSLAMLLPSLGTSIANVALPSVQAAFGGTIQDAQWVVIAYLVTVTALLVTAGRLGDLWGKRTVLLGGVALFAAASFSAALAPQLWVVIVARAVQGLGAAAMMSLTLAAVADIVPKERTGSAIGLLGTVSAVGTALGPSLGGILVASFGWPAVFLFMGAVGLVAFAVAYPLLPTDSPASPSSLAFDVPGTALLASSIAAFALAVTLTPVTAFNLVLGSAALAGLIAFVLVEQRAKAPLVHLAMLGQRGIAGGLVSMGLVSAILMTTLVVGPFYLTGVLGLDPAAMGLLMTIGPAVAALVGVPAGRLVDRLETRAKTSAGLSAVLAGAVLMTWLPAMLGLVGYVPSLILITAGYGVFQAANGTALMAAAGERRGVTSALLSLARSLGLVTGASAMGALFAFGASATAVLGVSGGEAGLRLAFLAAAFLAALALIINLRSAR